MAAHWQLAVHTAVQLTVHTAVQVAATLAEPATLQKVQQVRCPSPQRDGIVGRLDGGDHLFGAAYALLFPVANTTASSLAFPCPFLCVPLPRSPRLSVLGLGGAAPKPIAL